jgi:hypothetical protein
MLNGNIKERLNLIKLLHNFGSLGQLAHDLTKMEGDNLKELEAKNGLNGKINKLMLQDIMS